MGGEESRGSEKTLAKTGFRAVNAARTLILTADRRTAALLRKTRNTRIELRTQVSSKLPQSRRTEMKFGRLMKSALPNTTQTLLERRTIQLYKANSPRQNVRHNQSEAQRWVPRWAICKQNCWCSSPRTSSEVGRAHTRSIIARYNQLTGIYPVKVQQRPPLGTQVLLPQSLYEITALQHHYQKFPEPSNTVPTIPDFLGMQSSHLPKQVQGRVAARTSRGPGLLSLF